VIERSSQSTLEILRLLAEDAHLESKRSHEEEPSRNEGQHRRTLASESREFCFMHIVASPPLPKVADEIVMEKAAISMNFEPLAPGAVFTTPNVTFCIESDARGRSRFTQPPANGRDGDLLVGQTV
jgi:hypothetical protein